MFWRDNFLIYLIRASPGTVLKVFFIFPVIEEHDKVHNLLIMEALGKYKETVYSLKLPHPKKGSNILQSLIQMFHGWSHLKGSDDACGSVKSFPNVFFMKVGIRGIH